MSISIVGSVTEDIDIVLSVAFNKRGNGIEIFLSYGFLTFKSLDPVLIIVDRSFLILCNVVYVNVRRNYIKVNI